MAAKTSWSRERAEHLAGCVTGCMDVPGITGVYYCGELHRLPESTEVTQLCVVGVLTETADPEEVRSAIKGHAWAEFPGCKIKRFKIYDYVELEDGSVSWLVTPLEQLGAAMIHASGPIPFVKMLEIFAESRGLKFGASGLKQGDDKLQTPDEASFFKALGVEYVRPEDRHRVRTIAEAK